MKRRVAPGLSTSPICWNVAILLVVQGQSSLDRLPRAEKSCPWVKLLLMDYPQTYPHLHGLPLRAHGNSVHQAICLERHGVFDQLKAIFQCHHIEFGQVRDGPFQVHL